MPALLFWLLCVCVSGQWFRPASRPQYGPVQTPYGFVQKRPSTSFSFFEPVPHQQPVTFLVSQPAASFQTPSYYGPVMSSGQVVRVSQPASFPPTPASQLSFPSLVPYGVVSSRTPAQTSSPVPSFETQFPNTPSFTVNATVSQLVGRRPVPSSSSLLTTPSFTPQSSQIPASAGAAASSFSFPNPAPSSTGTPSSTSSPFPFPNPGSASAGASGSSPSAFSSATSSFSNTPSSTTGITSSTPAFSFPNFGPALQTLSAPPIPATSESSSSSVPFAPPRSGSPFPSPLPSSSNSLPPVSASSSLQPPPSFSPNSLFSVPNFGPLPPVSSPSLPSFPPTPQRPVGPSPAPRVTFQPTFADSFSTPTPQVSFFSSTPSVPQFYTPTRASNEGTTSPAAPSRLPPSRSPPTTPAGSLYSAIPPSTGSLYSALPPSTPVGPLYSAIPSSSVRTASAYSTLSPSGQTPMGKLYSVVPEEPRARRPVATAAIKTARPVVSFDFDGTLHDECTGAGVGKPLPDMIQALKDYAANGYDVVITTTRSAYDNDTIQKFLQDMGIAQYVKKIYNSPFGDKTKELQQSGALIHIDDRSTNLDVLKDTLPYMKLFWVRDGEMYPYP